MTHDPRNEVFLSALDLFTLLLFAFVGVWRTSGATSVNEALDLPLAGRVPLVRPLTPTREIPKDSIHVQWSPESVNGRDGETCKLLYNEPKKPEERFDVPCWPVAFSALKSLPNARVQERANGQPVLALCPPGEVGLEACSRLVLVARDHGLDAAMLVAKP